jgi:hypothetical protein
MNSSKKNGTSPFFALKFSACRGYSQRFADIVDAYIAKYPTRAARCCPDGGCDFCAGEPQTHVYVHSADAKLMHCGANAVEIKELCAADLPEIKRLINEEHAYLMKHQVGE